MARKPNYQFERADRERIKAAKLAEKARLKREEKERAGPQNPPGDAGPDSGEG